MSNIITINIERIQPENKLMIMCVGIIEQKLVDFENIIGEENETTIYLQNAKIKKSILLQEHSESESESTIFLHKQNDLLCGEQCKWMRFSLYQVNSSSGLMGVKIFKSNAAQPICFTVPKVLSIDETLLLQSTIKLKKSWFGNISHNIFSMFILNRLTSVKNASEFRDILLCKYSDPEGYRIAMDELNKHSLELKIED